MIKLWNHGLLDARRMNSCNIILDEYKHKGSFSGKSWIRFNVMRRDLKGKLGFAFDSLLFEELKGSWNTHHLF